MPLDVLERRERAAAGPQLPPVLRRDVRFGAAVYGTFLAASSLASPTSRARARAR